MAHRLFPSFVLDNLDSLISLEGLCLKNRPAASFLTQGPKIVAALHPWRPRGNRKMTAVVISSEQVVTLAQGEA